VAIKVLNNALAGDDDRARFLSEGQLAASITHPNTVYIFGSEEIDGAPVIAMELLSGGTLRDLVQANGPMPAPQAVDAILQVIAGLDAAARTGILHRDVKPANCFVDLHGAVNVGDFGLSITTFTRQQQTGMFLGTPQFAPPERPVSARRLEPQRRTGHTWWPAAHVRVGVPESAECQEVRHFGNDRC
jgi:serine/threonine protein kinase